MKYIDIHTHNFYNQPDIISINNIRAGKELPEKFMSQPICYGIHPWDADNADLLKLSDELRSINNLYAIGECGLDKKCNVDLNIQKSVFVGQAILSRELHKPLIIHCIGCFNDIIDLNTKINPHQCWIIHGFSGNPQLADQLIKKGFILSFGDSIFKENSNAVNSLRAIPKESFFLETDESKKTIKEIYLQASIIRNEPVGDIIELLFNQFKDLFKPNDGVE